MSVILMYFWKQSQKIGATVDRIDRHTVRINAATIGDLSVDYEYIKKSVRLIIF